MFPIGNPEEVQCPIDPQHKTYRVILQLVSEGSPLVSGRQRDFSETTHHYTCSTCGHFILAEQDFDILASSPDARLDSKLCKTKWQDNKYKLRSLTWEHHSQKLPKLWLRLSKGDYWPIATNDAIFSVYFEEFLSRWPGTVGERLDRILQGIARETYTPGLRSAIRVPEWPFDDRGLTQLFSESDDVAKYYLAALRERRWIETNVAEKEILVIPAGWAHVDQMQRGKPSTKNPAFVAMWFGALHKSDTPALMSALFNDNIRVAIEQAGYKCERVDSSEHNDFVMDKIMGLIRVAPFVVADFTGNRGGVYFEAGFARGLGIPVIHTCRAEPDFKDTHFDIKQINTVVWETPADLNAKLYHRIAGTLGFGPFRKEASE